MSSAANEFRSDYDAPEKCEKINKRNKHKKFVLFLSRFHLEKPFFTTKFNRLSGTGIDSLPAELRKKIAEIVAAPVASSHGSIDGVIGRQNFRDDVKRKIEKAPEPRSVDFVKPLPQTKSLLGAKLWKRGGRRVREAKKQFALREMRRQQKRMNIVESEHARVTSKEFKTGVYASEESHIDHQNGS